MSTNHYFQSGIPGGRTSEQLLMEDLIIECLKIYGFDVYYLPREQGNLDSIFNEDPTHKFSQYYPLEMYLKDVDGFGGEGDLLSKFGVEIRDTATFVVARRRWDDVIGKNGVTTLTSRPTEGDILYMPLTNSYFEIKRVESQSPFYQVGKLYTYELQCELVQYSGEEFNTGDPEIDSIESKSMDVLAYQIIQETGSALLLEYMTPSSIILEDFDIDNVDSTSQNDEFSALIDILDFTEKNPFGEVIG